MCLEALLALNGSPMFNPLIIFARIITANLHEVCIAIIVHQL